MKEAQFYKKQDNKKIQCNLCPHNCIIADKKSGICGVRKNIEGRLYSLVYDKPFPGQVDPIEKKPLFHFYPGEKIYSVGTVGCNLKCSFCQNWQTSQASYGDYNIPQKSPEEIIAEVQNSGCKMIAYTYNEPSIFYELMYDCAKLAKAKGIKNIIVSNGFINKEPLVKLCKVIDAANIDLKSFSNNFYKSMCSARLEPVLESIKILKKNKVWLELTTLLIPEKNDSADEIKSMCDWIVSNLGKDVPLHFSAFYPNYKMAEAEPTPVNTILNAMQIAKDSGINYVYGGNIYSKINNSGNPESTFCPKCKAELISRHGFNIQKNIIKGSHCPKCKTKIDGMFE